MQSISLNLILISEFNLVFLGICSFGKIQIIDRSEKLPDFIRQPVIYWCFEIPMHPVSKEFISHTAKVVDNSLLSIISTIQKA